ncbi:MAG: Ig-like domain-containing protein, partial [Thermoplasmatota archaeon]
YSASGRDHAIEKVSQWVERTLPLNQQESQDDERPTQPVRIAATHNGNCGELQDLTIAGSRCALIPARGAHLPGEDHVWSEFYLGGWHQWDNYWSDAGGVVADDLNYWWGWGGRGGSGIWASNGAGQVFDVGERYRSPDITGKLRVQVFDDNGRSVEGARVLVMSHWVTEQIDVDTGPYQGPLPTVPLPAIWGYTDHYGFCDLSVWRQNINVMVTSDLGTHVSGKFTIPEEGGTVFMTVRLSSSKPSPPEYDPQVWVPTIGTRYLFSFEIEGSYQMQRDLFSGVLYRHELSTGAADLRIFHGSQESDSMVLDTILIEGGAYTQEMRNGNENLVISLSDANSMRDHTKVRVKVWEVREEEGDDSPDLVIANGYGRGDEGIDNMADYYVNGWIVSSDKEYLDRIGPIRINGPLWDVPFYTVRDHPLNYDQDWSLRISAYHVVGVPGMVNSFSVNVYNETLENLPEPTDTFIWEPFIKNAKGPDWERLMIGTDLDWGLKANFGAYYEDPYGGFRGIGWIDDEQVWDNPSVELEWPGHAIFEVIDTSLFESGVHRISMTAIDPCGSLQSLLYRLSFIPNPPVLNLTSPPEGQDLYSNDITVIGDVSDHVELSTLKVRINDEIWDITDDVQEDGTFESEIRFKGGPGSYRIEVNATDNVGLWASRIVNVSMRPPPDDIPPIVRIVSPDDGERFEKGGVITIRGEAYDASGLSNLELSAHGTTYDILDSVIGRTFSHSFDTSTWTTGEKRVSLSGKDGNGNPAMDTLFIEIFERESEFKDREDPSIVIDLPLEGTIIPVGSTFELSGRVFDDGPIVSIEVSTDRGESYEDLTPLLSGDWDFEMEIDTLEIVSLIDTDPDSMKVLLENYPLMFRIEDGAGRQEFLEHRIYMVDEEKPSLLPPFVETDPERNRVLIGIRGFDQTTVHSVRAEVRSPEGETFRIVVVDHNELIREGDATICSIKVQGPFEEGTFTVLITATDPWRNSAETTTSFTIEGEDTDNVGIDPLSILLPSAVGLILLAAVIYGLVRAFRRRNPPKY